jgi:hypothetical protein
MRRMRCRAAIFHQLVVAGGWKKKFRSRDKLLQGRAVGSPLQGLKNGLGYAFASPSVFRKAASPASDTLTHFGLGAASAS